MSCPRPDKHVYSSKAKAERARVSATMRAGRFGLNKPTRSYLCDCGGYHLPSDPNKPKGKAS